MNLTHNKYANTVITVIEEMRVSNVQNFNYED